MARGGGRRLIVVTNILIIRGNVAKSFMHWMCTTSSIDRNGDGDISKQSTGSRSPMLPPPAVNKAHDQLSSSCWMPHARTGIYIPVGQERVMVDVPDGAASFVQTHWLRNDPHYGLDH